MEVSYVGESRMKAKVRLSDDEPASRNDSGTTTDSMAAVEFKDELNGGENTFQYFPALGNVTRKEEASGQSTRDATGAPLTARHRPPVFGPSHRFARCFHRTRGASSCLAPDL